MKKLYTFLLIFLSVLIFSQNWQSNNNPYNNPNRRPYDDLSKRSEQQINQDMNNLKKIINSSGQIYEHFKEEEEVAEKQQDPSGPGAPGEPVPIDKYEGLLFIAAVLMIVLMSKKRKKLI